MRDCRRRCSSPSRKTFPCRGPDIGAHLAVCDVGAGRPRRGRITGTRGPFDPRLEGLPPDCNPRDGAPLTRDDTRSAHQPGPVADPTCTITGPLATDRARLSSGALGAAAIVGMIPRTL